MATLMNGQVVPDNHPQAFWERALAEFERQIAAKQLPGSVCRHGKPWKAPTDAARQHREVEVARVRWKIRAARDPRSGGIYSKWADQAERDLAQWERDCRLAGVPFPSMPA